MCDVQLAWPSAAALGCVTQLDVIEAMVEDAPCRECINSTGKSNHLE